MSEEGHQGSLQPWQLFSALFVVFWATSAYFDQFLMTFVFCIAFGVLGEVLTSHLYGHQDLVQSNSFSTLTKLSQEEKKRIDEQHLEQKIIANQAIFTREDQEEEAQDDDEDDDGPPPIPAKDYTNEETEEAEYFATASKNVTLAQEPTVESAEISQLSTPPFDNVEKERMEETDANNREDDQTLKGECKKPTDQYLYKPNDFEDILAKKYSLPVDDIETQEDMKKIYAPDSSDDDEELEEEYANREVDFDESESEEEEFIPMHSNTKISDADSNSSKDEKDMLKTVETENLNELSNQNDVDIDLTDPDVQKAATKIQKVFKGFQVRKQVKET